MKQTSVEWFAEIVSIMGYVSTDILEQAKEMHKQEIIDAANLPIKDRWYDATKFSNVGEQYYSKTYVKSNI